MIKNFFISGSLMGVRMPPSEGFTLFKNLDLATLVINKFFLCKRITHHITSMLFVYFFIGVIAAIQFKTLKINLLRRLKKIYLYGTFIIITSTTTAYDIINNRLLSPIFPAVILLTVSLFSDNSQNKKRSRYFIIVLCLFLITPTIDSFKYNANIFLFGKGLNSKSWKESELINFLNNSKNKEFLNNNVFSNRPKSVYILAGIDAKYFPQKKYYRSDQYTGITPDNIFVRYPSLDGSIYIHFTKRYGSFYSIEDLKSVCAVQLLSKFNDGEIYKIHKL